MCAIPEVLSDHDIILCGKYIAKHKLWAQSVCMHILFYHAAIHFLQYNTFYRNYGSMHFWMTSPYHCVIVFKKTHPLTMRGNLWCSQMSIIIGHSCELTFQPWVLPYLQLNCVFFFLGLIPWILCIDRNKVVSKVNVDRELSFNSTVCQ